MRKVTLILLALILGLGLSLQLPGQAQKKKKREVEIPWSFRVPVRPAIPQVKNIAWVQNPIDAFILAKLESKSLTPSPMASRQQLIRRLSFDLTGLPPTPEEVAAFVKDASPDAYEKAVDRMLNSPRYGERWAMYWLDLVRFAESDGFRADDFRPTAWKYRDYVINSLNEDKPFNRFILEQLAGDELFPDDPQAIIATAFNRHFPDEFNATDLGLRRQEILNDITDVTSQVFLGLTLGCARCHDHKYDPILQKDYYRFQAFFAAYSPKDDLLLTKEDQVETYQKQMQTWEAKTAEIRQKISQIEEPIKEKLSNARKVKFLKEFQSAYDTPLAKRTPMQKQIADMVAKQVRLAQDQMSKSMKGDIKKEWEELNQQLEAYNKLKPKPLPVSMGITDIGPQAPPTFLLKRGNHNFPAEEVQPGFLTYLDKTEPVLPKPSPEAKTTGRRSVLAKWLASANNPLTARVMVNRLWQHHFGKGIIATPSDFGEQGDRPTHPELLDWLATEFIAKGWSLKAMHRLMVTSNTYKQSSARNPKGNEIDSDNKLLWRMNLQRLEGDALRDAMLAMTGKLNLKMGGPSVFTKLPKGLVAPGWAVNPDSQEHNRRSVYLVVKRNLRPPLLATFDAPDTNESCAARHVSTNAPQALTLLNDEFTLEVAKDFAARILLDTPAKSEAVIKRGFELALGRAPDTKEVSLSLEFFQQQQDLVKKRLASKQAIALPSNMPQNVEPAFGAVVVEYCHVLLNMNEFIYVD